MDNEERYERYMPIEMSILGSLLEIREMQAGRLPKPKLEDFFAHIEAIIKEEEANDNNPDQKI